MAFRLPDDYSTALAQALEQKQQQQERPVAFGYTGGGPQRFAGERLTRPMGLDGEFGQWANQDKGAQQYLSSFVDKWTGGPYGPDMGMPEGVA